MATDNQKSKAATAPKKDAATKVESPTAKGTPKDTPKDAAKAEGGETADAAPANYSRGEGQKPVTAAYRQNWNVIFGKKPPKKRKR